MKKIIGIIFLMISLVSFSNNAKAPDFNLKDQYGVTHSLENYKGKVIFLNFWATWCPPCKKDSYYWYKTVIESNGEKL